MSEQQQIQDAHKAPEQEQLVPLDYVHQVLVKAIVETRLTIQQQIDLFEAFCMAMRERPIPKQNALPFEKPEEDSEYFAELLVPAFVHEFGREQSNALSYIMSHEHVTMLFNGNDGTLFLQQTFGNLEFREHLKQALQKQPRVADKEAQMRLEFQSGEGERVQIGENTFNPNILKQIIHILRSDRLHVYPLQDKNGNEKDQPVLVSDCQGRFIVVPPVVEREPPATEEDSAQEEETTNEATTEESQDVVTPGAPEISSQDPLSQAVNEDEAALARHRSVVELREKGKKYRAIGKMLKISKSTVDRELGKHNQKTCCCYA